MLGNAPVFGKQVGFYQLFHVVLIAIETLGEDVPGVSLTGDGCGCHDVKGCILSLKGYNITIMNVIKWKPSATKQLMKIGPKKQRERIYDQVQRLSHWPNLDADIKSR